MKRVKILLIGHQEYRVVGGRFDKFEIIKAGENCWNLISPDGTCDEAFNTLREARQAVNRW